MARTDQPYQTPPRTYSAEKARQGEIILQSRWQRMLFIAGLPGFIVLALILVLMR
jgi:hypothetical protein